MTMLSIEIQMSLLLFTAFVGYLIATKLKQTAIVGQILVGILIGPSLLALITYTDFVQNLAYLGAVVLLFVIGLEFKIKEIFNLKYGIIALIGVLIPFISGFFLAEAFQYPFTSAVFIGAAFTATSVTITAKVLQELGKLQTDVARAIIGAAVIDDILGILVLSFSVQVDSGSLSVIPILIIIIKATLFVVLGALIGSMFLNKLLQRFDGTVCVKKCPDIMFIGAMTIAFLYAMVAELIGLSAIVGAFLAGMCLSGIIVRQGKNFKEGADYLQIIFGAIFFVALGILVDIKGLTGQIVIFIIVLTVLAILTKLVGCYLGAKLGGMHHKDSLIVGVGMIPRGEVAMIVALIGLNLQIIQQDIYVSIISMSLLTTLLVPFILTPLLNHRKNL